MSCSTLIELFGHIMFSFTRGVTKHNNPEESEFIAETFQYSPPVLESTGREWYRHPVDELIYQQYSDREASSPDCYLGISRLNLRVTTYARWRKMKMKKWMKIETWHGSDSDHPLSVYFSQSMFIGRLISLLTAAIVGLLYILISYLCYKTLLNDQFQAQTSIPVQVQWIRTISGVITTFFHILVVLCESTYFSFSDHLLVGFEEETGFSFHSCLLLRCTLPCCFTSPTNITFFHFITAKYFHSTFYFLVVFVYKSIW